MTTTIEWTEETWNPLRARHRETGAIGWHCEHASPGCEHCYAETRNRAGRCNMGTKLPFKPSHRDDVEIFLDEKTLLAPLRWRKARTVFVCSMTDLFGAFHTDEMLDRIFAVMALCPQHTFQVLTKRSDRMREYLANPETPQRIAIVVINQDEVRGVARLAPLGNRERDEDHSFVRMPLPNVWLGVSVEDQRRADLRIPDLLATPAALRWLSCEPLLGPVDLPRVDFHCDLCGGTGILARWPKGRCHVCKGRGDIPAISTDPKFGTPATPARRIDWVVCGGESGPQARPMHPDWARSLRDQCAAADVPFFFKQWGEWAPDAGTETFDTAKGRAQKTPAFIMKRDGTVHCFLPYDEQEAPVVLRVGKKAAGRLLDGALHDGTPAQGASQ